MTKIRVAFARGWHYAGTLAKAGFNACRLVAAPIQ